ncbi:MAG TPA: YbhN family protein [Jatrophihabitans sp.]|nr:YbhN family protein [Jatrophihabitans sp.]
MVAISGFSGLVLSRRAVRIGAGLAAVAVEIALVAPHLARGEHALADLNWGLVAAAVLCEVASIITYARLRRRLLSAGGFRVPSRRMGALAVASNAISVTVPAGTAVAAGYLYKQLRRIGAGAALTTWMLAAAAVVSGLAFSVITMAGTFLDGDDSLAAILGAGGLSLAVVAGLIAGLMLITRHPRPVVNGVRALCTRLPWPRRRAGGCGGEADMERVVEQLSAINPRARDWGAAFLFATVNWATDLACFVLCCYAVGVGTLGVGVAVLAYVAGLATSSISLLPGGIGTVEAGFMVGLAHAGVAAPLAVAGIFTYRLVAYGLVALVGWTVWGVLRRRVNRPAPALQPLRSAR